MPAPDAASSPPRRLGSLTLAAIFVAASAVTALDYSFFVGDPTLVARRSIHQGVLAHTATAPDRYRLLAPVIVEGPVRVLQQWMPRDVAFDRVYAVFYLAAMAALLWSQFAYLRIWFSDEQALIGVLLLASTLRITIRQHDYAPFSYLEPTFFAVGLLLILDKRRVWLGLLIALATFNRETAIFLVLLFAATQSLTRRTIQTTVIYLAIWAVVFVGVRLYGGEAERYWELGRIWRTNISQPGLTLYNVTAFLGIIWVLAIAGFSRAPEFVRRAALVIPAYAVVVAVWGLWWEVRLLMPLLPLVLPLALSALFQPAPMPLTRGIAQLAR
jgi:hypothetical protein